MRAATGIRRLGVCCLLAVIIGLGAPAGGRAQGLPTVDLSTNPWFIGFSELLPPAYMGVNTDSSDICVAGRIECVDRVARRLERQVAELGCDHNAVFSLAYARTTQQVAAMQRADPGFFSDAPWLNHYDAVFADFYFDAWNSWRRTGSAPPAWAMAFRAADRRNASAAGNLLLGLSAHVNRDLPFTLYAIGLVADDGSSRKADHDRVNRILNKVISPLLDEIEARYDPSARVIPGIGSLGDFLEFQALPAWRETAWRNAELLATAPGPAARKLVAATIEQTAAVEATTMLTLTRYLPPLTTSARRDAFCAARAIGRCSRVHATHDRAAGAAGKRQGHAGGEAARRGRLRAPGHRRPAARGPAGGHRPRPPRLRVHAPGRARPG